MRTGAPAPYATVNFLRLRLKFRPDFATGFKPVEKSGLAMAAKHTPWEAAHVEPLAKDIALVLTRFGGSAHQKDVVQCVAALKRSRGEAVAQDLAQRIIEAFERYVEWFCRPFGEGSQRWALQPGLA